MRDLEEQIAHWRAEMLAAGIGTPTLLDELENHLRDEMEQQVKLGLGAQQAFEIAVQRLGEPKVLKHEFRKFSIGLAPCSRRNFWSAVRSGALAFGLGATFSYLVVLPLMLPASRQYAVSLGMQFPYWSHGSELAFAHRLASGIGLAFACVGTLLRLVQLGVLDSRTLSGFRRYAIVINLLLGALLTTPEVVTQLLMFIPLQLLYEATVWIACNSERRVRKRI